MDRSAPVHAWAGPAAGTGVTATRYLDDQSHADMDSLDSQQSSGSQAEAVGDWSYYRTGQLARMDMEPTPREMKPVRASAQDIAALQQKDEFRFTLADLPDRNKFDLSSLGIPVYQSTGLLDAIARREEKDSPTPSRCRLCLRRICPLLFKMVALIALNGAFVYGCVTWGFQLRRHVEYGDPKYGKLRSFFSKFPDITLGKGLTLSDGKRGHMLWRGDLEVREGIKAASVEAAYVSQTSDGRLKTDVRSIGSRQDLLFNLEGVTFKWAEHDSAVHREGRGFETEDAEAESGDHYGFIAQEVRSVLPELVHENSDGMLSVEYAAVVPILVEAMKTHREEMDAMKATVEALVKEVARLRLSTEGTTKDVRES